MNRAWCTVPWWRSAHQDKIGRGLLSHIEKLSRVRTEVVSEHYLLPLMNVRHREGGGIGQNVVDGRFSAAVWSEAPPSEFALQTLPADEPLGGRP
jgi:hypothetical protein